MSPSLFTQPLSADVTELCGVCTMRQPASVLIAGGPSGTGCLAERVTAAGVFAERTATQFAVNMSPSSRLTRWRSNCVRLPFVAGADWSRLKRTFFCFVFDFFID